MDDVIRLCSEIADRSGIDYTLGNSMEGINIAGAGAGALAGGLLLGPRGIAVGGAVGGLFSWSCTCRMCSRPFTTIVTASHNLIWRLVKGSVLIYKCVNAAMAQRRDDVIPLCCKIAERSEFNNTWENTIIGMPIAAGGAGAGAGAGALLLGPPGFAVGASAGGLLGLWQTSGQFKSVPQILMELPDAEKQELSDEVVAVLGNLTWTDARQLIAIVMDDAALQQLVTDVLINYIKKKV